MLLQGVEHPNPGIRADCAHAMDLFADERCTAPLLRLLDDPVPRVRRVALHSLACDDCKLEPLETEKDVIRLIIDRATADPSIQVRRHATAALGRCADERAFEALEMLMSQESDKAILRNARQALRRRQAFTGKA